MLAIELLNMIQKFEEKYPEIDLSNLGLRVGLDVFTRIYYISSYKVGLEYIKFKTTKDKENKIYIPELKSILEKSKFKNIYIETKSGIFLEIPFLTKVTNLVYCRDINPKQCGDIVLRKEIKNVSN